jgi:hypothetical protein
MAGPLILLNAIHSSLIVFAALAPSIPVLERSKVAVLDDSILFN